MLDLLHWHGTQRRRISGVGEVDNVHRDIFICCGKIDGY